MIQKQHVEEVLRQSLREQHLKEDEPEPDVEKIIQMGRKAQIMRKNKCRAAISAAVLLAVVVTTLGFTMFDEGYANQFRQFFAKEDAKDVGAIAKDNAISGELEYTEIISSLEELDSYSEIDICLPEYLPDDYALDSVHTGYLGNEIQEIRVYYCSSSKNTLTYTIKLAQKKQASASVFDSSVTSLGTFTENGVGYMQFTDEISNRNYIYWNKTNLFYTLIGVMEMDELLKMAVSSTPLKDKT